MRRAFIVIVLVELLSFGLFSRGAGFYHDDWNLLEVAFSCHGYWSTVVEFGRKWTWSRPGEILQFPFFILLGGQRPVVYQALLLLLEVLQGSLFFLFLDGLLGWRGLSLAATCLAMTYPNHAVTHHWFANSPQSLALVFALAGLASSLRGLKSRRAAWTACGAAFYLAAGLCYESVLFLPLMLGGGLLAEKIFDGEPTARAAIEVARGLVPFGGAFAVCILWQRLGVPAVFGTELPKSAAISPRHALEVFKAGFGCITYQTVRLCLRTAVPAWNDATSGLVVLWAAFTASLAAALSFGREEAPESAARALWIAAGAAVGGFVAANLPYALSRDYWPTYVGIMGRTSALGALPGGIVLAAAAAAIARLPRGGATAQKALLAAGIGAFTWCNWHTSWEWTRSWRLQQDILRMVSRKAASLPDSATVLLAGAPRYINTARDEVIVFDAVWDFKAALRLTTGRRDLNADVVSERMEFEPNDVFDGSAAAPALHVPYRNLYLYRYDRDTMTELSHAPDYPIELRND